MTHWLMQSDNIIDDLSLPLTWRWGAARRGTWRRWSSRCRCSARSGRTCLSPSPRTSSRTPSAPPRPSPASSWSGTCGARCGDDDRDGEVQYLPQFPEDEFDLLREVHVEAERPPGDGAAVERRRGKGEPVVAAVAAGEVVFHRTRGVAHLRAGDRPEGHHHLVSRYIFSYLGTVILFLFHLYLYACIYFNSFIWTWLFFLTPLINTM